MWTSHGSFSPVMILVMFVALMKSVDSKCILFNFGDSNSDTGGLMAGLGFYLGPPAGRTFFNRTTGRFCDGRLYIDFICNFSNLILVFSLCCFWFGVISLETTLLFKNIPLFHIWWYCNNVISISLMETP
jgi:GDSL-like Lipase/Acylhydrolase